MIADTSAILAILFADPDAPHYARAISEAAVCRISVATFVEVSIVVEPQTGDRQATMGSVLPPCWVRARTHYRGTSLRCWPSLSRTSARVAVLRNSISAFVFRAHWQKPSASHFCSKALISPRLTFRPPYNPIRIIRVAVLWSAASQPCCLDHRRHQLRHLNPDNRSLSRTAFNFQTEIRAIQHPQPLPHVAQADSLDIHMGHALF